MGRHDKRLVVLTGGAIWVAALAFFSTGASAALLPGSILGNGDVEQDQAPAFPLFPDNWFASNTFDSAGNLDFGCTSNCQGAFWDTTNSVSPTHSLGLFDTGIPGQFTRSEWRSFAAPIPNPAGTAFLRWSWDVLYDVTGGTIPEFSVHMRLSGPFIGTGNLIEPVNSDHTVTLTGNSNGQFVTFTADIPVALGDQSYDIIFRTDDVTENPDTLGSMFIDDVSVVPIENQSDFDANLQVNGSDFLAWQRGLGLSAPSDVGITAIKSLGDSDGNLTVDAADLAIWEQEYGNIQALSVVQSVPEPTTGLLGLVAGVAMTLAGRRQRQW